jgi:hypothetical protein
MSTDYLIISTGLDGGGKKFSLLSQVIFRPVDDCDMYLLF